MRKLIIAPLIAYLTKLRFPVLFGITAVLFILDFGARQDSCRRAHAADG